MTPSFRAVRVGELLVPGQSLIVGLEGAPAVTLRIVEALRDRLRFALLRTDEAPPSRRGAYYRVLLGTRSQDLLRMIGEASREERVGVALSTVDVGEVAEEAAEEALTNVLMGPLGLLPRLPGFPKVSIPIVPIVVGGLVLVGLGVYVARR